MIDKITAVLTNPAFVNFAQNTKATVATESVFKAVGRPAFIMMDKKVDKDTRRYAAVKEGLYQMLCLGIYMTLVSIFFKNAGFKLAQKLIKNDKALPAFKNADEYENYLKLARMPLKDRKSSKLLSKIPDTLKEDKFSKSTLKEDLLNKENPKLYEAGKGAIELSYLAGSVIGLAWIASEISNKVLHPIMRTMGFEKNKKGGVK